jgi:hypothetical protein
MKEKRPNFFKGLANFFTSRIGLLVLGFVLTTVCGAIINGMYTSSTWKRDKQFELLKSELAKHDELLSDLTKMLGTRVYRLQRVVWVTDPDTPPGPETWTLTEEGKTKLNTLWNEYYQAVVDWNISYRTYTIKLRALAGDEVADKFFVGDTSGARRAKSGTLCRYFEQSHEAVSALKKAALTSQINRTKHDEAQREVDDLYNRVDDFVAQLYRTVAEKEHSDNPLKAPQLQR